MKHTSLPWEFYRHLDDEYRINKQKSPKIDICILSHHLKKRHEVIQNAEFICRACNSHYELLEICKEMAKQLNLSGSFEYSKTLAAYAKKVIAKAEGK